LAAKSFFSNGGRENSVDIKEIVPLPETDTPRKVIQRMEVTQGKLAMGFTSEMHGDLKTASALSLFADIFGGGPYSKLFTNVREKQSLCYYCSAGARRSKGLVLVDSGVEEKNAEKTLEAVLKELSDMQNGNFDDSVILASKKSITDSLSGYNDHASAIEGWYSRELFGDLSPEEAKEIINSVTREDIIKAARGVKLHTVYMLLPREEEKA
jgi:predicted Zn-dependent peptidase